MFPLLPSVALLACAGAAAPRQGTDDPDAWVEREVRFVHLKHARYSDRVTRDCHVVPLPADAALAETLEVPCVADWPLSRHLPDDREAIARLVRMDRR